MAQVRNLLRGLSIADPKPPSEQLGLLEKTLEGSGVFATAIYALLDIADGELTFTRAGHVPMLLAKPGGGVEILDGGAGPPLGSGIPVERHDSNVRLQAGSVLVLFTDGLVESRTRPLEEGIRAARAIVHESVRDPAQIADRLLSLRPEGDDDVAILVVQWDPRFAGSRDAGASGDDRARPRDPEHKQDHDGAEHRSEESARGDLNDPTEQQIGGRAAEERAGDSEDDRAENAHRVTTGNQQPG